MNCIRGHVFFLINIFVREPLVEQRGNSFPPYNFLLRLQVTKWGLQRCEFAHMSVGHVCRAFDALDLSDEVSP